MTFLITQVNANIKNYYKKNKSSNNKVLITILKEIKSWIQNMKDL